MTTIGVISDTHIRAGGTRAMPQRVWELFADVNLILHGGDLTHERVISELEAIAPVLAVHGNNDTWELMQKLPTSRRIEIENCILGLTHGDLPGPSVSRVAPLPFEGNRHTAANAWSHFEHDGDISCVVFGHSHRPLCEWHDFEDRRILFFNPGSPTDKRYGPHYGLGILRIHGTEISPELILW
jgi:uncharacterized protein